MNVQRTRIGLPLKDDPPPVVTMSLEATEDEPAASPTTPITPGAEEKPKRKRVSKPRKAKP